MVAPVVGGWLTDNYSWRWVFYINVPFGILATIGLMTFVRETQTRHARFDFLGFGTLALAVGALQQQWKRRNIDCPRRSDCQSPRLNREAQWLVNLSSRVLPASEMLYENLAEQLRIDLLRSFAVTV